VGAELPELARDRRELALVLAGGRAASQVLFTGADGQLYRTGYAPVRRGGEAGDEIVGVVGVEGSAAFFGPLRRLARAFALLSAVALAVLAAVAVLTARGLSGPLRRLMAAAERIGAGDLATPVRPEPTREIGVLARELERMREALEARDRQMQLMLAGVAHEVRNPLGGIALYAGLLQEDLAARGASEPLRDASGHVARIQQEIDYLQRIVEDFLAFAREQSVQRAPMGAPDLVEGAVALLSAEAQARGVQLHVQVQEAVLEADGSLLVAALVNLVKNAVQASPEGGSVRVEGVREGSDYLVRVRDAGAGVPEALQARIFEPFFTTRQKGSGLGLALARKVARAHGGELSFRSRPGETVFTLALPLSS
jgi:signal transduction histidine kinase